MNRLILLAAITTMVTVACSHNATKTDSAASSAAKAVTSNETADKAKVATTPGAAGQSRMECSKKTEVRTLEVREKGKGCELAYTKGGKEGIVATGSHGTSYCMKAQGKIHDNLKSAGYDCK